MGEADEEAGEGADDTGGGMSSTSMDAMANISKAEHAEYTEPESGVQLSGTTRHATELAVQTGFIVVDLHGEFLSWAEHAEAAVHRVPAPHLQGGAPVSDERCTIAGCFHVVRRLRLCNKHLQRLRRWGDATKTLASPRFVPPFRGRPQP